MRARRGWDHSLVLLLLRALSTRAGSRIKHLTGGSPRLGFIPAWEPVQKGLEDVKGRIRSAGPEVPSWAVLTARCSWADPAPGGGKPVTMWALPLSLLRLVPHFRSLLVLGSCSHPQSPWPKSRKPVTSLRVLSPRMQSAVPFASMLSGAPPTAPFWTDLPELNTVFSPSDSCYCRKLPLANYFPIH